MTNGENECWGVVVLGFLLTFACFVLDYELLVNNPEACIVDGNDPFRGTFMHLVRDPGVSCTSEDDKAKPIAIGTMLNCLVIASAHGSVCIGGAELAGRKANAWAFMAVSLFVFGFGIVILIAIGCSESRQDYVHEVFHGDELPLGTLQATEPV
jgi:hypothetical protein